MAREVSSRRPRRRAVAEVVGVRDDDRGAEIARLLHGGARSVIHSDQAAGAQRDGVAGSVWIRVVVGEFEPRHEQQAEHRHCPNPLPVDLLAIGGEGGGIYARSPLLGGPGIVSAQDVIGHAKDVVPGGSVQIDQLR